MKTFYLQRNKDESGVSGTGRVAEGVIFADGRVALHWLTEVACVGLYNSIHDLEFVHGHGGNTLIVYEKGQ